MPKNGTVSQVLLQLVVACTSPKFISPLPPLSLHTDFAPTACSHTTDQCTSLLTQTNSESFGRVTMYQGRRINLNHADVYFNGEHLVTMRVEVVSLRLCISQFHLHPNAPPPGLTRWANAQQQPRVGWVQGELTDALNKSFLRGRKFMYLMIESIINVQVVFCLSLPSNKVNDTLQLIANFLSFHLALQKFQL